MLALTKTVVEEATLRDTLLPKLISGEPVCHHQNGCCEIGVLIMTTQDDLSQLREKPYCDAVSKLEELMAQSGRAFLIGAGCSKCAGLPLTSELTEKTMESASLDKTTKAILGALKKQFDGAADANIEDYLSELIDLLAISERRGLRGATQAKVTLGQTSYDAEQLRAAAEAIKHAIAQVIDIKVSIAIHQRFIRAVHRPVRPGKSTTNQSVDYLVLNYDTLIEDALALERLPYADGLDGGSTGWWSPSTFDRDGLTARVLKLHGSINWCEFPDDPLPRRVAPSLSGKAVGDRRILIWPASTKYRETQLDPYAQLADRARQVLRPSLGGQRVLIVCGYRFGDSHINLEIDRALRESVGRLTVVVFTADDGPTGLVQKWTEDPAVGEQVLVFGKRGFFHGKQVDSSPTELTWWKFETLTRLLGDER